MKKLLIKAGPLAGLIIVLLLFSVLAPDGFLSAYNLKTIITQTVIVGIAALGMTLIIIAGGIDLSVGSQIALGTVVIAQILGPPTDLTEVSWGTALAAAFYAILACGFIGFLNGFIVAKFRIVAFIVTLGMMQIARGLAKWLANEQTISTPSNPLQKLMLVEPDPSWLMLAPGVWVNIALLLFTAFLLSYTILGRYTFAIGSNEKTAVLCGINVVKYKIYIYIMGALFAGIASVMQYANLTVGDPTAANGLELDVVAAVVIGGGSLSGGEGSAFGSLLGALIMAVLRNGCNMLGVPNYVQEIIIGVIIISAVGIDRLKHRKS
jgi:ribose transport system permease protein